MTGSPGTFYQYPALKSMSSKVVGFFCCLSSESKYERLDSKLQKKMTEIKINAAGQNNFRSIDSIIMKFPQFKDGLKDIRNVFEQYDEDKNATIDCEELKKCLQALQLTITEEETDDLFYSCDINENEGIQLKEFIVLLCLIYFLKDSFTSSHTTSNLLSPQIEATFRTIIEAFLFLDKNEEMDWNRKGKVSFREFLFAFINWVGIDTDDEDIEIELS